MTPLAVKANPFERLLRAAIVATAAASRRQQADATVYDALVHQPTLRTVEPSAEPLSDVALATSSPDLSEQEYNFEPLLSFEGSVTAVGLVKVDLPIADWDY